MDEDKLFGPLTIRQFLYAAAGFALCYGAYTYLEIKYSIAVIVIVAGICISLILNAPKIVIDENYLKLKKANSKNQQEFEKWVRNRIAILEVHIYMLKEKGMTPDPKIENMIDLLESMLPNKEVT